VVVTPLKGVQQTKRANPWQPFSPLEEKGQVLVRGTRPGIFFGRIQARVQVGVRQVRVGVQSRARINIDNQVKDDVSVQDQM